MKIFPIYVLPFILILYPQILYPITIDNLSNQEIGIVNFSDKDTFRKYRNERHPTNYADTMILKNKQRFRSTDNESPLHKGQVVTRWYFAIMTPDFKTVLWASYLDMNKEYVFTGPINGNYHMTAKKSASSSKKSSEK